MVDRNLIISRVRRDIDNDGFAYHYPNGQSTIVVPQSVPDEMVDRIVACASYEEPGSHIEIRFIGDDGLLDSVVADISKDERSVALDRLFDTLGNIDG